MPKLIKSPIELQMELQFKCGIALDNTLDRLLDQLKLFIEDIVYDVPTPWGMTSNGDYGLKTGHRTGQFYDSWQKVSPTILGNMMVGEINQALEVMEQFMIGNVMVHEDRDNLADIIETGNGYMDGSQMEGYGRNFWSNFSVFVVENLSSIFLEECVKVGLPIKKVSVL